jgi:cytidylate kinase
MECDCQAVEMREERQDPLYYRLLKSFFRGSAEGVRNAQEMKLVDADCIREVAERVVRAAAAEGRSILVGRGSAYYLHDRPDAFHVFIYAPFDDKVRRLERAGASKREAVEQIDTIDRDRAAFIKRYFGAEWPNRHLFHLMINSKIGEEAVVDAIRHGVGVVEQASKQTDGTAL